MPVRAYLRIIRPANCIIASAAVAIAALVAVNSSVLEYVRAVHVSLASCVVFLFVAAGNALNDYFDYEVDKVNHPDRPIPSGQIHRDDALTLAIVLFVPTFFLGLFINMESLIIVVLSAAVMVSYEKRLKRRGLVGNLQISWLVASLFLFGGISVYESEIEALVRVAGLSALAFLATIGREITKDIEDMRGDRGRRTLPISVGPEKSALLSRLSYSAAILLSVALFVAGVFGLFYLGLILLADAIFILSMTVLLNNPSLSSILSKAAMVVALVAFLLGALLI